MKNSKITYQILQTIMISMMVVGIFFSNALLSISTIIFFLYIIIIEYKNIPFKNLSLLQKSLLTIGFIYFFWAFWKTESFENSVPIIISKLSILSLGFLISNINIEYKYKNLIINLFILILITISFYTIFVFANDINYWKDAYSKGQVLPTFIHHSKYSFLIICTILYLLFTLKHNKYKIILLIYFIIYLHFLSVKTGIILLYLIAFFSILYQIINKKWYYIVLFIIPFVLYQISPTLQLKKGYIQYDIKQYNINENVEYSDARRLISYKIALAIFKENKIMGIGLSNYKKATQEKFIEKYGYFDNQKMMYVHNSYLHILASCGIVGLLLFLISILSILYYYVKNNILIFSLLSLYFITCLWDAYTEQLVGLSIFVLIIILGNKEKNE